MCTDILPIGIPHHPLLQSRQATPWKVDRSRMIRRSIDIRWSTNVPFLVRCAKWLNLKSRPEASQSCTVVPSWHFKQLRSRESQLPVMAPSRSRCPLSPVSQNPWFCFRIVFSKCSSVPLLREACLSRIATSALIFERDEIPDACTYRDFGSFSSHSYFSVVRKSLEFEGNGEKLLSTCVISRFTLTILLKRRKTCFWLKRTWN